MPVFLSRFEVREGASSTAFALGTGGPPRTIFLQGISSTSAPGQWTPTTGIRRLRPLGDGHGDCG